MSITEFKMRDWQSVDLAWIVCKAHSHVKHADARVTRGMLPGKLKSVLLRLNLKILLTENYEAV